eukprot:TRINITY_DN50179_c0_g1_i1.p1 TRINITY_DN50179_c0_g1~~TRINITY_DN50179_c0_g1_i1.p1  ORF type:complete len:200 (+),score=37.28 TRINITY_DN50179_c0_g1_i1:53-652(+)
MASRGKEETQLLKSNINDQLNRLMLQLEDVEELKDEFDSKEEYDEAKRETMEQLRDFQAFLAKSVSGDMTLTDEFGAAQLAIQAAISEAFKTPEVLRMFANKEDDGLRRRLEALKRDFKLKTISSDLFNRESVEILVALKKMGHKLSEEETTFLSKHSSARHLEDAVDSLGAGSQQDLMSTAQEQIEKSKDVKDKSGSK